MNTNVSERIESTVIQQILLLKESNCYPQDINYTNQEGKSLLHFACEHGLENLCALLLSSFEVNINITDNSGNTPLMLACKAGYIKIVKNLLLAGADPHLFNDYGVDLLPMTLLNGDMELFLQIMEISQNVVCNSILGQISILNIACALGKTDFIELLCGKFPNFINTPAEKSGMTPLMLAVSGGFTLTVRTLLNIGVDRDATNAYSMSAYQIAKSLNYANIEEILLPFQTSIPELKLSQFFVTPEVTMSTSPLTNESFTDPRSSPLLNTLSSDAIKTRQYPLTPNICISPRSKRDERKKKKSKGIFQLQNFRRRSKSVESKRSAASNETEAKDVLEYILISTKLYDCWPIFKTHEINFKTFLTMSDDDLKSIGILKSSLRTRLLKVIRHNKRVFC